MQCELCGKDLPLVNATIEGVDMQVCVSCSKMGFVKKAAPPKQERIVLVDMVVVNAGPLIKAERERRGMRQIDLAKMLQIKDSLLHNIETGNLKLEMSLARKIQDILGVELVKQFRQ